MTTSNDAPVSFDSLGLPETLLSAVKSIGFENSTDIQAKTIPPLLAGKDVLGEAQTGTGKTAAFGLPALAKIDVSLKKPQLMVLAPTRELAMQVAEAIESFGKNMKGLLVATLYGGQSYQPQFQQLERGAQVVVGTPGRLMDHLRRKSLKLGNLSFCVLDEADEMLNMGFLEDIQWILDHLPETTQMALFSATMPPAIRKIANRFLKDPEHIKIAAVKQSKANISQFAWKVSGIRKITALERIAEIVDYDAMIVFVRTRSDTVEVAEQLERAGYPALALNGDMNQAQRERCIEQMKSGKSSILVATDVVARGLDIPRISLVVNYDLPGDNEAYVHRIGRTGRAGREGMSIAFVRPREMHSLRHYERLTSGVINTYELPNIEEIGKKRIERTRVEMAQIVADKDLVNMREIVEAMANESELSMTDLAAALLFQKQLNQPLQPKEDPKPRRETRERSDRDSRSERGGRNESRGGRNERGGERGAERGGERAPRKVKVNRTDVDWQTYRLEVGKEHGARPGDIVGAIANEISLDSSYIGAINLHDKHTYVQLPKGMPEKSFEQLKRVKIRRQSLEITVSDVKTVESTPTTDRPRKRQERSNRPS
ncbi:MAG: ATP-dependent RNA helicase DeaD [Colwellia sp.]|jgi:ATP-dependent RNA helicase DeaD|uniref:DEAD/DEAH box helicase n=2 Tax=Colwellia TaxID=28228 RepID=UPI00087906CC|nr:MULTISPECIES: DEAD/DEAH box helicase [unclassified Colwellia]MBA6363442.1 DEAD/DEAH box helicase [Colwellia sp. BRX8-8]AOW78065.1 RNA helicase [Colwellia sp. PAMC 20917]MBA6337804.1 DEAD/DEAH box helicase [Colwellia sp. BRX8-7]MBA6348885.1 DEAD/DEAH box helicase [Colwellia sp. BRX8-9]MBA6355575.1 DEAD/DEAH box helicase [Colwellia sp. BRX8-3]|tara:strand:+ start:609 stop:2411 length:1803 start_codon:yes stop_codon:yes gene_type:complete